VANVKTAANMTSKNKTGRPKKTDKKDPRNPPYSKQVVINAIKECGGFYTYVAKYLGCSSPTAKIYVNKWPETKELFLMSQFTINDKAIKKFESAIDNGEQWAIDRILKRMPEEGLSPDQKEEIHDNSSQAIDMMKEFAKMLESAYSGAK